MSYEVWCRVCPAEEHVYVPLDKAAEHVRTAHPDYHSREK